MGEWVEVRGHRLQWAWSSQSQPEEIRRLSAPNDNSAIALQEPKLRKVQYVKYKNKSELYFIVGVFMCHSAYSWPVLPVLVNFQ